MSKWLEDLLLNIEIWLYRRLRKLLQHGDATFGGTEHLHAILADKESKVAAVYNDLEERLVNVEEGVPVRPLPAEVEGLPSVRDLNHLRASVGLLAERKIEDASPDIPDGVSLLSITCDSTKEASVTELIDTNLGWDWNKTLTAFPNLTKLTARCKTMNGQILINRPSITELLLPELEEIVRTGSSLRQIYNIGVTELSFPKLRYAYTQVSYPNIEYCNNLQVVYADALIESNSGDHQCAFIQHCNALTHFYARGFEELTGDYRHALISFCPNLTNVYLTAPTFNNSSGHNRGTFGECPKLIHLEVGCYHDCDKSLNIKFWSPTMSLRTDTTASDYIDLREDKDEQGEFIYENNLQQFLANFKNYIADRLADRSQTTSLTLTLSQAVYDAIQADTEFAIVATITAKNWNITH